MKRILFFLSPFLLSNLNAQTAEFLLQVRNEFNGTNNLIISNDDSTFIRDEVVVDLSHDTLFEYEFKSAPICVGKISFSDFSINKDKWIKHFHNVVLGSFSPDYEIIHYEIESDRGEGKSVNFYYYETSWSGFLPDSIILSNGFYYLSVLSNGNAIISIPVLIQNNTIIQLSN